MNWPAERSGASRACAPAGELPPEFDCADVAGRNNDGTSPPEPGYAQTNISPANPNAIEVHTKDKTGANEDSDFQLIVVCP